MSDDFWQYWTWDRIGQVVDRAIMHAKSKKTYWTDGPFAAVIDELPTDLRDEEILVMLEEAFYEWHGNPLEGKRPSHVIIPALKEMWAI